MRDTAIVFVVAICCYNNLVYSQNPKCPGDDWGDWDEPCKGCLREHTKRCNVDNTITKTVPCIIDPCECHIKVNDEQRSTAFILPQGKDDQSKCDIGIRSAWYRFTSGAGGMMPTSCPKERACGSTGSLWLKGAHPTKVGEISTLESRLMYDADCDALHGANWNIKAKKCQEEKDFFIYKLEPVTLCPMVYCAGSEKRCPAGLSSFTGFTPGCSDDYPKLRKNPVISALQTKEGNIQLKCTLDSIDVLQTVRHEVQWIQGETFEKIKVSMLIGAENEAVLENKKGDKLFTLPNKFSCKVSSYFNDKFKTTGKGKPKTSNVLFAGITVEPKTLTFKENEQKKWIKVYSTISIPDGKCPINVQFRQNNGDVAAKHCKKCFTNEYHGVKNAWEVEVRRKQFDMESPDAIFIRLSIVPSLQKNVRIDWKKSSHDVTVGLQKSGLKTCTGTGDPHFRTFDGLYYHMFHVGDYVMMGTAAKKTEIHMRTHVCNRDVSCICGIAVRYGDDVVILDMCLGGLKLTFPSKKALNPAMKVSKIGSGKNFRINTPDAVNIDFKGYIYGSYIWANVYITTNSDYRDRTFGMCGNYNNNPNDEFEGAKNNIVAPRKFTDKWRLPVGTSLFYYKPGQVECEKSDKTFCTCIKESIVDCDVGKRRKPREIPEGQTEVEPEDQVVDNCVQRNYSPSNTRRRRSTSNVIIVPNDDDGSDYIYDPKQINTPNISFPTPNGITEPKAINECTAAVKGSSFGKACLQMYPNLNYSTLVKECVEDVKILDNLVAPKSTIVTSLTELCKLTLIEDSSLYSNTTSNETSEEAFQPPQFLIANFCPNDCSNNGKCANRTCICDDGYITDDCSMKNDTIPTVEGISNYGLCDIRKRDCRRVRIIGYNFIDSPKLSCRATKALITDKSPELTSKVSFDDAYLLTFSELICELPETPVTIDGYEDGSNRRPSGGFSISMSNDGINYSGNETLFIIYDGKCINCTRSGNRVCNQKPNTCKVNNYCFDEKEVNPNDWCQMCYPSISSSSFSNRTSADNAAPFFNSTTSYYAFKGQINTHQLNATDPEEKNINYQIKGNEFGISLSHNGLLTWTPTKANKTFTLKILAIDVCGESTEQNITLITKQCPCEGKNDGYCKWKNAMEDEIVCICPDGCAGDNCDEAVEGKTCKIKVKPTNPTQENGGTSRIPSKDKTTIYIIAGSIAGGGIFLMILAVAIYFKKKGKNFRSTSPIPMKNVTPVVKFHQENEALDKED